MKEELLKLGLSEKEIELYLICVRTGETTANRISNLAGFARSTTYDILDRLRHMGFITTFVKDKKTYFLANNPEILLTTLNEQKKVFLKKIENEKKTLESVIPKLKKIQEQINDKPIAEVFEGNVSISKILDEIAEKADFIKIIGNQKNAIEIIDYKTDNFRLKRKERKIKTYQILEDSNEARNEKIDYLTNVRFLKSIKKSKDAIFIYNNTVVHLILSQEISAIRIRSNEYARAQEINFDELWIIAKKK